MHPFYKFLKKRLKKPLPGEKTQFNMAPVPLDSGVVLPRHTSQTAHPGSVLIPLFPDDKNNLHVIFTLRTNSIRHGGQISFPGGRSEPGELPLETALRETCEEIGISPGEVFPAGSLTPLFVYKSDNQVTPFVGFLKKKPQLALNPSEVEEAFITPLHRFLTDEAYAEEEWNREGISYQVPYWKVHRVPLWGATAMMLNELLELYREFLSLNEG